MTNNTVNAVSLPAHIKVIDVDTHLSEPHDLWTSRAPSSIKSRVPQVVSLDGELSWVIDGTKIIGKGAAANSCILKSGEKSPGFAFRRYGITDVHAASFDMKARVQLMNDIGIWAQVVYPNILGFGGQHTAKVDPELRLACVTIYNDAMAEFQAESDQRIFPMALLPWWDIGEAVKEAERAHAMGLRGININSDPHNHADNTGQPLPDLSKPYWDPLWEACDSLGLPINFHIGASEQSMDWVGEQGWPSLHEEMRGTLNAAMLFTNNARVMGNIILSGLLDRFPSLRFVSVESGIGWVPFMLEAFDYQYRELSTRKHLQRYPSEYFETNFHACFWFENRDLGGLIKRVGVNNVMFETDFPHPTCLHPNPLEHAAQSLEDLSQNEKQRVLSGNAAALYRIPIK